VAEALEITAKELKRLIDSGTHFELIDVREQDEYDLCHINGSRLIPLSQLRSRVRELDVTSEYVFYCHTGERSDRAVNFLSQLGFKRAKNLEGGIDAWAVEIDRSMPRY
jgi:sulfur-carrier protein adenylyltransferase/sulfurtransferase